MNIIIYIVLITILVKSRLLTTALLNFIHITFYCCCCHPQSINHIYFGRKNTCTIFCSSNPISTNFYMNKFEYTRNKNITYIYKKTHVVRKIRKIFYTILTTTTAITSDIQSTYYMH